MGTDFHILAEGDGETVKVILSLLFVAGFVVVQILSSLGKKKDKHRESEANEPVVLPPEAPMPQRQPPPRRASQREVPQWQVPGRPAPPVLPAPPVPHQQRPTKQQRRAEKDRLRGILRSPDSLPQRPPEPAARPEPIAATADSTAPVTAGAIGKPRTVGDGPNRLERLRALMRPGNLRKEFILTEILQPPVGVRGERADG